MDTWDATVVGGGPAGLTCGRELARTGARVRVVETQSLGGQLMNLTTLREHPITHEPVPAWDIVEEMLDGLAGAGGALELDEVQRVHLQAEGLEVESGRLGKWRSGCVVLATGSTEQPLDAAGASALEGRGLSYCADCDGPLFKDRRVAVVGHGRVVAWEALALADLCSQVFALDCSTETSVRARNAAMLQGTSKVVVVPCSRLIAVEGQDRVEAIRYYPSGSEAAEERLVVDGVFGASRGNPALLDVSPVNVLDGTSRVPVGADLAALGAHGLFAIGDARTAAPMTLANAIGDAVQAAESVLTYLDRDTRR